MEENVSSPSAGKAGLILDSDRQLITDSLEEQHPGNRRLAALLVSTFIISACTIIYELLIGAIASYLIGNSITQF